MKKPLNLVFFIPFLFFAAFSFSFELPPGEMEKGWNLISVPCDVSAAEVKQALGADGFKVFERDGAGYRETESLQRGRGYVLNSNAVLNISYVCKSESDEKNFVYSLKQGWNLIGNPYHKAVGLRDALGGAAPYISSVYEYLGNRFVEITLEDEMKPWRGYWVYKQCSIVCSSDGDCEDGNGLTADSCLNPGACDAACSNTSCDVACSSDSDCGDGDESTTDICNNPGACEAKCEHTPTPGKNNKTELKCDGEYKWVLFNPAQCVGYPWWPYAEANGFDEAKAIKDYFKSVRGIEVAEVRLDGWCGIAQCAACEICPQGGTISMLSCEGDAQKIMDEILLLGQFKGQTLTLSDNPAAFFPGSCHENADCDDGDESTTDVCVAPGTCIAPCIHVKCMNDGDCAVSTGDPAAVCRDPGKNSARCVAPACRADEDCVASTGSAGATCRSPGTLEAKCEAPACSAGIICDNPEGCDRVLWKKAGCRGDDCHADPPAPGTVPDNLFPLEVGGVYDYGHSGAAFFAPFKVLGTEAFEGRTYKEVALKNYHVPGDLYFDVKAFLRTDEYGQVFYVYEDPFSPGTCRESLFFALASDVGDYWESYFPAVWNNGVDEGPTRATRAIVTKRFQTGCLSYYYNDYLNSMQIEYWPEGSSDATTKFCVEPGKGITHASNFGP